MSEFIQNLTKLHRHYSTYVIFIFSSALTYWSQLPLEQQTTYLTQFPVLKMIAPALGFVAFLVARGIPQAPKDAP